MSTLVRTYPENLVNNGPVHSEIIGFLGNHPKEDEKITSAHLIA